MYLSNICHKYSPRLDSRGGENHPTLQMADECDRDTDIHIDGDRERNIEREEATEAETET